MIDVVIPSCKKDLITLDLAIDAIKENGIDIGDIYVVSERKLTSKAIWISEENFPFKKQDIIDLFLSKCDANQDKESVISRVGWYFQQLIKLHAHLAIPELTENFLVLDSDTIFLKKIRFLDDNERLLLNIGKKNHVHLHYVSHIKKLSPLFKTIQFSWSGISHHMVFKKTILNSLMVDISSKVELPFWRAFLEAIDPRNYGFSGASEYELFFYYCLINFPEQIILRELSWKDIPNLGNLNKWKTAYDFVSCHSYLRVQ